MALLLDAVPALVWVIGAAVTGVAAAALFDPHPAPPVQWLLGLALHLLSGSVPCCRPGAPRTTQRDRGSRLCSLLGPLVLTAGLTAHAGLLRRRRP